MSGEFERLTCGRDDVVFWDAASSKDHGNIARSDSDV